jgi:hypothetical protein
MRKNTKSCLFSVLAVALMIQAYSAVSVVDKTKSKPQQSTAISKTGNNQKAAEKEKSVFEKYWILKVLFKS